MELGRFGSGVGDAGNEINLGIDGSVVFKLGLLPLLFVTCKVEMQQIGCEELPRSPDRCFLSVVVVVVAFL